MRNNIKVLFSDIDGTLLKSDGKTLQRGVAEMLIRVNAEKIPIVFISGKNSCEMQSFVDILYKKTSLTKENFNPVLAANCGSCVDKMNIDKPLDAKTIEKIREIVSEIDQTAVLVYKTKNVNYVEKAMEAKSVSSKAKKGFVKGLKAFLVAIDKFDLPTMPLDAENIEKLINNNEVYSLNIFGLHTKKLASVMEEKLNGLKINANGVYMDVARTEKLDVIKQYAVQNGFTLENVAMLGDSKNDEEALMNCGVGFLCNLKKKNLNLLEKVMQQPKKYATYDLSNKQIMDCLTNRDYSDDYLKNITRDIRSLMKYGVLEEQMPPQRKC